MNKNKAEFSFNEWIIEHELEDIKQFLIKHGLKTPKALIFPSPEFGSLVSDDTFWTHIKSSKLMRKLQNAIKYTLIWNKLEEIPGNKCLKVFVMNESELVVIQYKRLCKYNIKKDEWLNWIEYPDKIVLEIPIWGSIKAAYNSNTNFIYIILKNERLLSIDLISENTKIIDTNLKNDYNFYTKGRENCIFIENKFHIIGRKKHFIWNEETGKFHPAKSNFSDDLQNFSLIYWKKRLFMMGGYGDFNYNESIYTYSSSTNEWSKLQHKLPKRMVDFGYVTNGNYIFIFGGYNPTVEPEMCLSDPNGYDQIYIYNPDNNYKQFIQSSMYCPFSKSMYAVLVNKYVSCELLTYGYLRKVWRLIEFKYIIFLSDDLINLISLMSCIQNVHLFNDKGQHWKIKLDHI